MNDESFLLFYHAHARIKYKGFGMIFLNKIVMGLMLVSAIHAGSSDALFDLDLGDTFGGADSSMTTIGTQELLLMGFTLGVVIDENQLLYASKGGAVTQMSSFKPSSLSVAYEQLGYEYIFDFGYFLDFGITLEAGSYMISTANASTGISSAGEVAVYAIINISKDLKMQVGYGSRMTGLSDSDVVSLGLTRSQIDGDFIALRFDLGAF